LQKFLWRVPWDAHGEVATSGNAGSLHIFAEAGLNRIGVPTRTIQQVLHPKRRSFPGPLRHVPTVLPLATAPHSFQITQTTLSYLPTRKYISDALVRPLQRDLPTLDRPLHRGPRRTCLSHVFGGKLRMLLCRINKVHELLPEQILERALDTKSPTKCRGLPGTVVPRSCKIVCGSWPYYKRLVSSSAKDSADAPGTTHPPDACPLPLHIILRADTRMPMRLVTTVNFEGLHTLSPTEGSRSGVVGPSHTQSEETLPESVCMPVAALCVCRITTDPASGGHADRPHCRLC
jgi:hypothetical protein